MLLGIKLMIDTNTETDESWADGGSWLEFGLKVSGDWDCLAEDWGSAVEMVGLVGTPGACHKHDMITILVGHSLRLTSLVVVLWLLTCIQLYESHVDSYCSCIVSVTIPHIHFLSGGIVINYNVDRDLCQPLN